MNNEKFCWFQGVIEDRDDPLQMGRVKIRCLGYHTENKQDLPTGDLPWATPITPITSASVTGIGDTPLGPVTGTWVVGFFRDGIDAQQPVYFGTIASMPTSEANVQEGFNDPSGTYPLQDLLNEPDTNRLARGEVENTIVESKRENLDEMSVPGGGGSKETLTEPETPYNAQYPTNKVFQSETGHIREVDDTPGSERLHTYHRAGTFEEIHPDGSRVNKIVGDNYSVVVRDNNVHIQGTVNIDIDGDSNISVGGNANIVVDQNIDMNAKGNIDIVADGQLFLKGANVKVSGSPIDLN